MNIFFILFSIAYAILSWRRLDWAVMFLLASLPAYLVRFNVLGIPTTLLEVMILIAFIVWIIKTRTCLVCNVINNLKGRRTTERYPFDVEIVLLLIIAFVSAGMAGFSSAALGIWKAYFFEPVLVFLLVMNVFKNTNDANPEYSGRMTRMNFEKILWPLAVSALVVSFIAIFQKITGLFAVEAFWPRVTGPFPYPNALGLFLGPLVMIMIGWLASRVTCYVFRVACKQRQKVQDSLIAITILFFLAAILLARSEGAAIGIMAAIFVFGILAGGKLRWVTLGITVIAGLGILAYAPVRIYAIEKITLRDLSGEIRKQQWRETAAMMTESPYRFIFGTGLSGYQAAIKPYHQEGIFFNKDREPWEQFHRQTVFNEEYRRTHWQPVEIYMYPHNILLNFWSELGLAGALLFIWIIGKYMFPISNFQFLTRLPDGQVSKQITNYKLQIINSTPAPNNNKFIRIGLLGAMIVIIVHGLVDVPYFKNDLSVLFWVMLAMAGMINLFSKKHV